MGDIRTERNRCFQLNTRDLCLICLKDSNPECEEEGKQLVKILVRYFNCNFVVPDFTLQSHQNAFLQLSIPFPTTRYAGSQTSMYFPVCENCAALANTISQLYQQLELASLKLNSYGRSICKIMKMAKRVTSRVTELNEKIPETNFTRTIFDGVRNEISKKCIQTKISTKNTLATARVLIEKFPNPADINPAFWNFPFLSLSNSNHAFGSPEDFEENYQAYLGCLISLWVVVLLSLLDTSSVDHRHIPNTNSLVSYIPTTTATVIAQESTKLCITDGKELNSPVEKGNSSGKRKRKLNTEVKVKASTVPEKMYLRKKKVKPKNESDVSEDIIQEFERAYNSGTPNKKYGMNTRKSSYKPNGSYTPQEMQLYSLITDEQAKRAVQAIQTIVPFAEDRTTVQVEEASEIKLFVSNQKKTHWVPSASLQSSLKTDTDTGTEINLNKLVPVVVPPIAIDFVELNTAPLPTTTPQEIVSPSTTSTQRPICTPVLLHKCKTCLVYFNSRAQVEKHRAVVHKIRDYVECPVCSKSFSSYFHLEQHRNQESICRLDSCATALEMLDIARPLFPAEKYIKGSTFCPQENCYEVFEDITKYKTHLKTHGSFQCRFGCSIKFAKAHELAVHEIHMHSVLTNGKLVSHNLKCPRCDFIATHETTYLSHFIFGHLNISPYVEECRVCRIGFYTLTSSKAHFHMYHDVSGKDEQSIFRCEMCHGLFLRQGQLDKHRNSIHGTT